jgi:hypothetical protein
MAGGESVDVEMTFKHRTKTALEEFIQAREGKGDVELFLEMVTAWELEEAFDADSVKLLLENYAGAAVATFRKYIDELVAAKAKN